MKWYKDQLKGAKFILAINFESLAVDRMICQTHCSRVIRVFECPRVEELKTQ